VVGGGGGGGGGWAIGQLIVFMTLSFL